MGFGNMGKMMKQMQKAQAELLKIQEGLAEKTVEATSGGGMVKVVANGKQEIMAIEINPEAVDPEDVEMLADMVLAAVNEALRLSQELMTKEMGKVTGGLNIPGMF